MSILRVDTITSSSGTSGPALPAGITFSFQIKSIGPTNVGTIAGGYITDSAFIVYGTYDGIDYGADLGINLKTEVNNTGVIAPAANTNYYLYLKYDLAGSPVTNTSGLSFKPVQKGLSGAFIILTTAPDLIDSRIYLPLAALRTNSNADYTNAQQQNFPEVQGTPLKAGATSFGLVPLGGIIPVFTSLSGTMSSPGSGLVNTSGYIICDGAAIPGGNSVTGTTPNLTDSRFIMGAATAGTTGGSNTKTLITNNLPSHSHVMDHAHANTLGVTGTFASSTHTHDHQHTHQYMAWNSSSLAFHAPNSSGNGFAATTWTTGQGQWGGNLGVMQSGATATLMRFGAVSTESYFTGSPLNSSGTQINNTGAPSATASPSLTGSVTNFTGSTQTTGTGMAFDILPQYVTAVYFMRVK